jgi:HD-GYP domain-containing protein (c-di-GMP phosphodiesterase class II)
VALNLLGVFSQDMRLMLPCMVFCFLVYFLPIAVFLIHDRFSGKKPSVLERPDFKFFILICSYLGIGTVCVTLTHTVLFLTVVPALMAAQYRDQKRLLRWTLVSTLLLVPVGVYGGFFFGALDRNLLKVIEPAEAATFEARLRLATPQRMTELLTHYVLPRLLCLAAVDVLASGIVRRNGRMLDREAELARKVREEMERRNGMLSRVIEDLAAVIETRDEGTGDHVLRTKAYVGMLARWMQQEDKFRSVLTDDYIGEICNAAPLHDVGKIAVSDLILLKPGRLTDEEFETIKQHTVKGGKMIRNIFSNLEGDAFLKTAEEIAVSHHEKWNGKGYPYGLAGEAIPLPARIMAVADVFDALVSERVYKAPMPPEEALDLIEAEGGSHFDPDIVRVVAQHRRELLEAAKNPIRK